MPKFVLHVDFLKKFKIPSKRLTGGSGQEWDWAIAEVSNPRPFRLSAFPGTESLKNISLHGQDEHLLSHAQTIYIIVFRIVVLMLQ